MTDTQDLIKQIQNHIDNFDDPNASLVVARSLMVRIVDALAAHEWKPIDDNTPRCEPILVQAYRQNPKILETVCARWYETADRWYIYGCGSTSHSPQWLDECTPVKWQPLPTPPYE